MFERFQVIEHAPMKEYTSLRLGGPADWLLIPRSAEELIQAILEARDNRIPVTIIGQGSNILVMDEGIRGLVIRTARGLQTCHVDGSMLFADAGVMMGTAASAAAEAGLSGIEFASGIPGTVGGGVIMNAGAYEGEMSQVVCEVSLISLNGEMVRMNAEQLEFGYRHSVLQDSEWIVSSVVFSLKKGDSKEIRKKMTELNRRRAEKQPLDVPSAGSTFKRPANGFAAALIDQCGLKGYAIGGAMVSPKHAGFLVNTGNSSSDYLALIKYVQKTVEEQTGIRLEPEIRILP